MLKGNSTFLHLHNENYLISFSLKDVIVYSRLIQCISGDTKSKNLFKVGRRKGMYNIFAY